MSVKCSVSDSVSVSNHVSKNSVILVVWAKQWDYLWNIYGKSIFINGNIDDIR